MKKVELENEREKLKETLEIIKKVLTNEQTDLKNLYNDFVGEREALWKIADAKKLHIKNLEESLDRPYFARIDFTSDEDKNKSTVYIGKNGVMDNSEIVVTDWRAPISSLYYDAEVGNCSYESPEGEVKGDMSLKRQFEIEKGILEEYFDVDLVSNDALLQKYLNSNNDARLKSIVSTIQKEQNDVIRKKMSDNIIVQGVAGSGKTTVALHRIAYLVYNYLKSIKQSQYMVIGPNPVFLKYIKSVLPELDVSGVEQCTYEDFAKNYIDEDININPSDKKVLASISGKNETDIDKFKNSIKYKDMIKKFLDVYFYGLTSKPLMVGNFEVIPKSKIEETFKNSKSDISSSLDNRIEITINRLCVYIENNIDDILRRYSEYTYVLFKNAKTEEEKEKLRNKFTKERAEINKSCRSAIRKYFSKSKVNATKLYKLFLSAIEDFDIYNYNNLAELKKNTLKNTKNKTYDFEDLASLVYIKSEIAPNRDYDKIRHVVVDEAQDLGEFNFYSFRKTLPSATFSIFGDLAQSIYDYRGIDNWDEVNDIMFNNTGEVINFNKSYRTTSEIMNVADDVAESIGLGRSELVVRHGDEVELDSMEKSKNIPEHIVEKIAEYKEKGCKTIAVISKTDEQSKDINEKLSEIGLSIPNVKSDDDLSDEKFNICTISNQLAKGLEFDGVIINNVNENIYSSKNNLDMKLLYVAITRALHELDIVYSGELTNPLKKSIKKNKEKQLIKKSYKN